MKQTTLIFLVALALFAGFGCVTTPVEPPITNKPLKLSWSYSDWTKEFEKHLSADWAIFDSAKDMTRICPKYKSLDQDTRETVWGEFWVILGKYESSYNPKSYSVDVGSKNDKGSWSVGLYQVSVNDQPWAGGGTKYTFAELQTAAPNIHLAMILMKRQITKAGLVLLPNSSKYRYWAPTLDGNRFSKIPQIIAHVRAKVPGCQ